MQEELNMAADRACNIWQPLKLKQQARMHVAFRQHWMHVCVCVCVCVCVAAAQAQVAGKIARVHIHSRYMQGDLDL